MRFVLLLLVSSALAQTPDPPETPPAKSLVVSNPQVPMREALEKQKASIARQQFSIHRQAQLAGASMIPEDPPEPVCSVIGDPVIAPLIDGAAQAHQLSPELIRAVIEKESGFKPCAVSRKGALGLMQLMPATAEQFGLRDVFDPKENIDAGTKYLKQLLDKYGGDLAKALGAYNAGPTTVDQAGGTPDIPETQEYVSAIMKKLDPTRTVPPSTPKPKPTEN
ncbi:MAG: lytic transglycosylase domain-containing protein [Candidatus Sulfopaludibacter sp.]|nr:lytic transglycosylase domain-containing protein [Candidatus Sulfopaludibacter sp.]